MPVNFSWPTGLHSVLQILQDGFTRRSLDLPNDIRGKASKILLTVSEKGTIFDCKWSLEVAGVTYQPVLVWLLRYSFSSGSQWLEEVAYRQTARLNKIPNDISSSILRMLVNLFIQNRIYKESFTTRTHLSRLYRKQKYLRALRLLEWIKPIDILLHLGLSCFLSVTFNAPILFLIIRSIFSCFNLKYCYSSNLASYFLSCFRLLLYPLSWAIFAVVAVTQGQFTHPLWWAFFIFIPLWFRFINNQKYFTESQIYSGKTNSKVSLEMLPFAGFMVFVCFVLPMILSPVYKMPVFTANIGGI